MLACTLLGAAASAPSAEATQAGPYPGAALFRPDGVLTSAPATVHQPSFGHAAFVVGTDDALWWSTDSVGWRSLGAPPVGVVGDPAAASWADGRIDVFVRGGDNRLWQTFTTCGGCSWSGWIQPLGNDGTLASAPTVTSWGPGRLDVFVLGTDGQFYQRYWNATAWDGAWLARGGPPPGASADRAAAASWGLGRVDLFARGTDNRLWQTYWTGTAWTGWFSRRAPSRGPGLGPCGEPWGPGCSTPGPG